MGTEPKEPTLSEVVRTAVQAVDTEGRLESTAELQRRFEDRDEPVTAIDSAQELPRSTSGPTS